MRSADYTYEIKKDVVHITDLNLGNISVTNDAENVLSNINYIENITNKKIIYTDSDGYITEIIPSWGDDGKCEDVIFKFKDTINVCAISDLHGYLPEIKKCDILCIAGDISPLDIQFKYEQMYSWLENIFIPWINLLPVEKVYLVAGNHDAIFQKISKQKLNKLISKTNGKLEYLKNESTFYISNTGVKYSIFGTPYCHIYGNWPFMISEDMLIEKFKQIPDNIDILISHDTPYNLELQNVSMDSPRHIGRYDHIGNVPLMDRLSQIKYKWLFHGHIHSSDHRPSDYNGGKVVNTSVNDESYTSTYEPFYTQIHKNYE